MRGGPRVVDETETALNSIQKKPLELKRLDWDDVEKNSAEASRGHATAAPCESLTAFSGLPGRHSAIRQFFTTLL
jgi:hypothetical protein